MPSSHIRGPGFEFQFCSWCQLPTGGNSRSYGHQPGVPRLNDKLLISAWPSLRNGHLGNEPPGESVSIFQIHLKTKSKQNQSKWMMLKLNIYVKLNIYFTCIKIVIPGLTSWHSALSNCFWGLHLHPISGCLLESWLLCFQPSFLLTQAGKQCMMAQVLESLTAGFLGSWLSNSPAVSIADFGKCTRRGKLSLSLSLFESRWK